MEPLNYFSHLYLRCVAKHIFSQITPRYGSYTMFFFATLYGMDGSDKLWQYFHIYLCIYSMLINIKYTNLQRSEFIAFRFSGLFSSTFTTYSRGLVTFRVLKSQVSELLFRFIIAALIDLKKSENKYPL